MNLELNKISKQILISAIDNANCGLVIADDDYNIQYLNEFSTKLLGLNCTEEIRGKSLISLYDEKLLNEVILQETKKLGSWQGDITGNKLKHFTHEIALSYHQGSYLAVIKDITGQQDLIQKLKESEARHNLLIENTGTAIMVIEEDTTISSINKQMEKTLGYTKEEIEGKMSWMKFIEEDRILKELLKYHNMRRYFPENGKAPGSYESKFVNKKGKSINVICNVSMVPKTKKSVLSLIDISEIKATNKKIKYLNNHDKLTGLYNREYFEKKVEEITLPENLPVSIIFGDVNGLKLTNDAFGHEKGDELIRSIAGILKESCRADDIIARWGGDEFVVLLPRASYRTTKKICDRITESCDLAGTDLLHTSIALGFSTLTNQKDSLRTILKNAEDWMYKNKLLQSKSIRSSTIKSLEETLLEKDYETEEHAKRLKLLAMKMGNALHLPQHRIDDLILLAGLHDIGKIAIDDTILLKKEKLTGQEWELMKQHPAIGYRIAKSSIELASIAEGILHHHEWWNGTGYPAGLKEKEIPLISRIISIIDSYDVMLHKRIYKKKIYNHQEAISELKRCAGTQFDPYLVKVFVKEFEQQNNRAEEGLEQLIELKKKELQLLMNSNKLDEEEFNLN